MTDLLSGNPAALQCPAAAYHSARQKGVHFSASMNAYVVSSYEDVLRIVLDTQTFSSSNALGAPAPGPEEEMSNYLPYLLTSSEPEHAHRRCIVNRAFTPRHIAEHEPAIEAICQRLVNSLRHKDDVDFVKDIAVPLPISAIAHVLGLPDEDLPELLRWSQALVEATVGVEEFEPQRIIPPGRRLAERITRRFSDASHGAKALRTADGPVVAALHRSADRQVRGDGGAGFLRGP